MRYQSFIKQISSIALVTSLSRVAGLCRTLLLGELLGRSNISDIFFLAFKIPNLFRRLLAEGAVSSSFIPLFSSLISEKRKIFLKQILLLSSGILFLFSLIGITFASWIMEYFFFLKKITGNLDTNFFNHAVILLQIMFSYIAFVSLAAIFQGVLNTYNRFILPAFAPFFLNIPIIVAIIFILPRELTLFNASIVISFIVLLGGILQMIFLFLGVLSLKEKVMTSPKWTIRETIFSIKNSKEVKRFFVLLIPVAFASSVYQLNHFLIDPLAFYLGEGIASALQYSIRLQELPIGVIIVSITTVSLTRFSKKDNKDINLDKNIQKSFISLFYLLLPIITFSILTKNEIVQTVYQFQRFTNEDIEIISFCLGYHMIAILPIGIFRLQQTVCYSQQNTKAPLKASIIALITNILLAYIFVLVFKMKILGILIASIIAPIMMTIILIRFLMPTLSKTVMIKIGVILFCTVVVSFIYYFTLDNNHWYQDQFESLKQWLIITMHQLNLPIIIGKKLAEIGDIIFRLLFFTLLYIGLMKINKLHTFNKTKINNFYKKSSQK